MNRSERRRLAREGYPIQADGIINIKASDVEQMKADATQEAVGQMFKLLMAVPLTVLNDKWGFGKVRCERFIDQVIDRMECVDRGYVGIDDLVLQLYEQTGITLERVHEMG